MASRGTEAMVEPRRETAILADIPEFQDKVTWRDSGVLPLDRYRIPQLWRLSHRPRGAARPERVHAEVLSSVPLARRVAG